MEHSTSEEKKSDIKAQAKKHPLLTIVLVTIILWTFGSMIAGSSSSSTAQNEPSISEARALGSGAYLRLPNNTDSSQVICLAPTKDVYDEYTTALMARDTQGLVDLAVDKGLFCVGNGSQVKVIDTSVALTKVRVVKGMTAIDDEKIGEAGWSAREWVVSQ